MSDPHVPTAEPRAPLAGGRATVLHHGRRVSVGPDGLQLGRLPENDVVLDDPNVSRFHAEGVRTDAGSEVRDLTSRNGTRVNGQLVRRGVLDTGSEIGIGPYRLIFDGIGFVARAEQGALRLDAEGVTVRVKDKQ